MTADIPSDELDGVDTADDVKVRLIRPGFSTHGINMGQRFVELGEFCPVQLNVVLADLPAMLETSLEKNDDGAKLHIAPLPPNPNVLAPGPCLLFKVIKGIPSKGTMVMIGSGKIETQPTGEYPTLPETSGFDTEPSDDESQNANKEEDDSSALAFGLSTAAAGLASVGALMILG